MAFLLWSSDDIIRFLERHGFLVFTIRTFLSLALRKPWAREGNRPSKRFALASSEGFSKAMPPSAATGVDFVIRSRCGAIGMASIHAKQ